MTDANREKVESSFRKNGAYPSRETLASEGPTLKSGSVMFNIEGENYDFFWSRPLSSGFSIVYSSSDDRIRIQD